MILTIFQAAHLTKLREDTADKPDFQDFEDASDRDPATTGNVSSVGTPLPNGPSTGGGTTKLKLTFNKGAAGGGGSGAAGDVGGRGGSNGANGVGSDDD